MIDDVNNNLSNKNTDVIQWKNQAVVSESLQKLRTKLEAQMRAMAEQPFLRWLVLQAPKDLIPKPVDVKRVKYDEFEGYDQDIDDWENWCSDEE